MGLVSIGNRWKEPCLCTVVAFLSSVVNCNQETMLFVRGSFHRRYMCTYLLLDPEEILMEKSMRDS